jgi:hypothetical protein
MKNNLLKVLFLMMAGVLGASWFHTSGQSGQTKSPFSAPPALSDILEKDGKHSARPPRAEFGRGAVESQQAHERRLIREKLHGKHFYRRQIADPGSEEVNGQAETMLLTFVDGVTILKPGQVPDPPGLPVSSPAVVVATVLSGEAFVSEDRDFVYSDYQTKIDQILKPDAGKELRVGERITTWVPGGSVHFPSGHLKHFLVAGRGFPEVGTQYVLFLGRDDSRLSEYEIWAAYALKDGVVLPLDAGHERYEGMNAADFLATLQEAVKTQWGGLK